VTRVHIPLIKVMFWGQRTGAAGPAAILFVRQLGSQALLFAPQLIRIGNPGTVGNLCPRGMSIPPAHNRSPLCIVIIQYTVCRVVATPPCVQELEVTVDRSHWSQTPRAKTPIWAATRQPC
jgi:hypothetical protein